MEIDGSIQSCDLKSDSGRGFSSALKWNFSILKPGFYVYIFGCVNVSYFAKVLEFAKDEYESFTHIQYKTKIPEFPFKSGSGFIFTFILCVSLQQQFLVVLRKQLSVSEVTTTAVILQRDPLCVCQI